MTATPTWTEFNLSSELLGIIEQEGFKSPTPVQAQSIPAILEGKDVLVSSQTGSGKTASFVIPIVEKFKNKNGTYILALAPTRELAQQTGAVFETFGTPFGLKTVVCIGGASIPVEKEALSSSPHIIVATPGRLCDHLERGNVWLDFIQCLIFDEADRMLDMGFAKQIEQISEQIPKERQTLMFSATFAPKVEKLAKNTMRDPVQITIERAAGTAPQIEQMLYWLDEEKKANALLRLLEEEKGTVFVFANAKERVYQIWRNLEGKKFTEATYIHSDIPQEQREQAVADFKAGKYRVLIATDVMGRGIDVDDVAHVVNYDVPREPEDYVHRIGRTGRRGRTGIATTFALPRKDEEYIKAIAKLRGVPAPEVPSPKAKDQGPEGRSDKRRNPKDQRSRGPRTGEQKPREERSRDQRPRDQRPREHRPRIQENRSQPQSQATPVAPPPVQKSGGFLGWIKRLFS